MFSLDIAKKKKTPPALIFCKMRFPDTLKKLHRNLVLN